MVSVLWKEKRPRGTLNQRRILSWHFCSRIFTVQMGTPHQIADKNMRTEQMLGPADLTCRRHVWDSSGKTCSDIGMSFGTSAGSFRPGTLAACFKTIGLEKEAQTMSSGSDPSGRQIPIYASIRVRTSRAFCQMSASSAQGR